MTYAELTTGQRAIVDHATACMADAAARFAAVTLPPAPTAALDALADWLDPQTTTTTDAYDSAQAFDSATTYDEPTP